MDPRGIARVIWLAQSETLLLRFLRRGHDDSGCSCNHHAVCPSDLEAITIPSQHISRTISFSDIIDNVWQVAAALFMNRESLGIAILTKLSTELSIVMHKNRAQ